MTAIEIERIHLELGLAGAETYAARSFIADHDQAHAGFVERLAEVLPGPLG